MVVSAAATFAHNALWVVREKKDAREGGRMWPSGEFVPQAREVSVDSLARWLRDDGDAKIRNEDVLVYVTVGTTHTPRLEDWPVIPVENGKRPTYAQTEQVLHGQPDSGPGCPRRVERERRARLWPYTAVRGGYRYA